MKNFNTSSHTYHQVSLSHSYENGVFFEPRRLVDGAFIRRLFPPGPKAGALLCAPVNFPATLLARMGRRSSGLRLSFRRLGPFFIQRVERQLCIPVIARDQLRKICILIRRRVGHLRLQPGDFLFRIGDLRL